MPKAFIKALVFFFVLFFFFFFFFSFFLSNVSMLEFANKSVHIVNNKKPLEMYNQSTHILFIHLHSTIYSNILVTKQTDYLVSLIWQLKIEWMIQSKRKHWKPSSGSFRALLKSLRNESISFFINLLDTAALVHT